MWVHPHEGIGGEDVRVGFDEVGFFWCGRRCEEVCVWMVSKHMLYGENRIVLLLSLLFRFVFFGIYYHVIKKRIEKNDRAKEKRDVSIKIS